MYMVTSLISVLGVLLRNSLSIDSGVNPVAGATVDNEDNGDEWGVVVGVGELDWGPVGVGMAGEEDWGLDGVPFLVEVVLKSPFRSSNSWYRPLFLPSPPSLRPSSDVIRSRDGVVEGEIL